MEPAREDTPPDLVFEDAVFGIDWHPRDSLIAVGLINGAVFCYGLGHTENRLAVQCQPHKKACRDVQFSCDGLFLFTASTDRSITALDVLSGGKHLFRNSTAHDAPINCLQIYDNLLASGDDEGGVRVWDIRQRSCVVKWQESVDYISDMVFSTEGDGTVVLLAASADGTLSAFDMTQRKLRYRSDDQDDELLSVAVVKSGKKVVCGTQEGVLDIWTWNQWGDISDRFPGHPQSVEALVKIDESTLVTGSSDGLIRVVTIQPNRLAGLLGEHQDGLPVELLARHPARPLMASAAHDACVKFWNVDCLGEGDDDDDEEEEEMAAESMEIEAVSLVNDEGMEEHEEAEHEASASSSRRQTKTKGAKRSKLKPSRAAAFYEDM